MAKYDDMSFGKAFAAARKEKGAGSTFMWKGKSYSTNQKGESGTSSAAKTDIAKMAGDAIDRSAPTRPRSRPAGDTGTRPRSRPAGKAPTATSVSTPEVTTEKLAAAPQSKPSASQTSPDNPPSGVPAKTWRQMTPRERMRYFADKLGIGKGGLSERPRGGNTSGMAKGGMVGKSGYAKGGMVKSNCGASMKPTQKSSKGK